MVSRCLTKRLSLVAFFLMAGKHRWHEIQSNSKLSKNSKATRAWVDDQSASSVFQTSNRDCWWQIEKWQAERHVRQSLSFVDKSFTNDVSVNIFYRLMRRLVLFTFAPSTRSTESLSRPRHLYRLVFRIFRFRLICTDTTGSWFLLFSQTPRTASKRLATRRRSRQSNKPTVAGGRVVGKI